MYECGGVGVWPTLAVDSAPASVCGCVCALVCAGSVRASGQGVRADRAGSGIPGPLADTGLGYSDRGGRLAGRKAEFLGTIRLGRLGRWTRVTSRDSANLRGQLEFKIAQGLFCSEGCAFAGYFRSEGCNFAGSAGFVRVGGLGLADWPRLGVRRAGHRGRPRRPFRSFPSQASNSAELCRACNMRNGQALPVKCHLLVLRMNTKALMM